MTLLNNILELFTPPPITLEAVDAIDALEKQSFAFSTVERGHGFDLVATHTNGLTITVAVRYAGSTSAKIGELWLDKRSSAAVVKAFFKARERKNLADVRAKLKELR